MPKLIPIIKAVRKGYSIDKRSTPEWAFTLNSRRNHLKKKIESPIYEVTLPARTSGVIGQRTGFVIEHNLGYSPFIDAYAKGSGDIKWKQIPSILSGTDCPAIYAATTQGDYETVFNFYVIDIETPTFDAQTIQVKFVLNYDPSKDAWDS